MGKKIKDRNPISSESLPKTGAQQQMGEKALRDNIQHPPSPIKIINSGGSANARQCFQNAVEVCQESYLKGGCCRRCSLPEEDQPQEVLTCPPQHGEEDVRRRRGAGGVAFG